MAWILVDESSLCRGVEGILDDDGDVLVEHREDCRRIDDLRTEVAKLHGLDEREFVDDVSRIDDTWIGSHEAIDIGPYFKHVGIQSSSNNRSSIVRTATSQVSHFASFGIATDESAEHNDRVGTRETLTNEWIGEVEVADVFGEDLLCLDDFTTIDMLSILDDGGNDAARYTLAVADNRTKGAGRKFADQEDTFVDVLQFAERLVEKQLDAFELLTFKQAGNNVEMTFEYELEFIAEGLVANRRFLSSSNETVGNSTKGTDNDNDRFGATFDDLFYILDACNGAHRGATKFEYVHI